MAWQELSDIAWVVRVVWSKCVQDIPFKCHGMVGRDVGQYNESWELPVEYVYVSAMLWGKIQWCNIYLTFCVDIGDAVYKSDIKLTISFAL